MKLESCLEFNFIQFFRKLTRFNLNEILNEGVPIFFLSFMDILKRITAHSEKKLGQNLAKNLLKK